MLSARSSEHCFKGGHQGTQLRNSTVFAVWKMASSQSVTSRVFFEFGVSGLKSCLQRISHATASLAMHRISFRLRRLVFEIQTSGSFRLTGKSAAARRAL